MFYYRCRGPEVMPLSPVLIRSEMAEKEGRIIFGNNSTSTYGSHKSNGTQQ